MSQQFIKNLERTSLNLALTFNTRSRDGLLLWQGDSQSVSDWISAGLKDGYLEFQVSFGNGKSLLVRSSNRLNDGNSHRASFSLDRNATLVVDGGSPIRDNNRINEIFDVSNDYLYVGGHPDDIATVTNFQYAQGFEGCLTNLGIVHYRLPGVTGIPKEYGMKRIPFSKENFFIDQVNVKCVKMCGL